MKYRSQIELVIADNQPLFQNGLTASLSVNPDFEIAGITADAEEAITLVSDKKPDVILFSWDLPPLNGCEILNRLQRLNPATLAVAIGSTVLSSLVKVAREKGAKGFLSRCYSATQITEALHCIAHGGISFPFQQWEKTTSWKQKVKVLNRENRYTEVEITTNDLQLMEMIRDNKTNYEIAESLHLSKRTIEDNREKLIRKMGVQGSVDLVVTALRSGLL